VSELVPAEVPEKVPATSGDFQVLIVDRDRELCRTLTGLLTSAGYRVDCLVEPVRPDAVRDLTPDLLLLDVPEAPGPETELLRCLSLQRTAVHCPVIVTSGQPELEFELLDVFDLLPKPLDEERLLEDVALLASRGQAPPSYPHMDEVDLALFQNFLVSHSGLHFDRRNALLLERGLQRRMRAVRARNYRDYFDYLDRYRESRQELKKLLGLLTVGETYFFRYLAHFEALLEFVLPEVIEHNRPHRRLRIWSAGCSTGEEPYSLAMMVREHFPELLDWDLQILATDVNKRALSTARAGRYGPRTLRATDSVYLERYFRPDGDRFQLAPEIRDMVRFGYLNLCTGSFPGPGAPFDLIFCRNVMIYFQPETTRQVVRALSDVLRPGGYLFLGHAETLLNLRHDFERVQHGGGFFYRLRAPQPEPVVPPPRPAPPPQVPPQAGLAPAVPAEREKPPAPAGEAAPDLAKIYVRATQAFAEENFRTASHDYAILLRHSPEHVGALVGYGFLLANRGEFEEALGYCQRALAVDDLCPEAYFLKGLIRELEDRPQEALVEYRRTLLLDMTQVIPHYSLSRVYRQLGRTEEAVRELRNTLRLLERLPADRPIPYSGGLVPPALDDQCRRELARFGKTVPKSGVRSDR